MSGAVLLTGGTGFLGMETLARLIDRDERVLVLVRAEDDAGANERLSGVMARLYDEAPAAAARVQAVRGDLLADGLGLSARDRAHLLANVDRIVHCAASISFELPLADARAVNVGGVQGVVQLARDIAAGGQLRQLLHVSTAYVSGRHAGRFGEDDLELGQEFRNTYERSKHEAEVLLRAAAELPLAVVRPSIVVGHRASGWTPVFNVIYWPIRAFERGLLDEVPARPDSIVDYVPVDYVADGIVALLGREDARGTYSLVAGERALTAAELAELHASMSGRAPLRFVPHRQTDGLPPGAEAFVPYFDVRCTFADERAQAVLADAGVAKPDPRDYLEQLIAYARDSGWGKRGSTRQAAFGLGGG